MQFKRRLGQVGTLKEEELAKAGSSGNEEDKDENRIERNKDLMLDDSDDDDKSLNGDKDDDDNDGRIPKEDLGPNAHVSLLDQHTVLKKKAEGLVFNYFLFYLPVLLCFVL